MIERITAAQLELINQHVFHMKQFYVMLHEWLGDNEYVDEKTGDDKFETLYMEKRDQNGNREIWIWWRVIRFPQGSNFFRYKQEIDFHVVNMTDTEIMSNGKKVKAQIGELTVRIKGILEVDYKNTWEKSPWLKKLTRWFRWKVYKDEVFKHKELVYEDSYKIEEVIKQFLELKGFKDLPEGFWPVKGL